MIDDETYRRILTLKLGYQRAIDDDGNLSMVEELEKLTSVIISDSESTADDVRRHLRIRTRCLVALINNTDGAEQNRWIREYIVMLERAYEENSPSFENEDIRTKLLAIRKFMDMAFELTMIDGIVIANNGVLSDYLDRFYEARNSYKWQSTSGSLWCFVTVKVFKQRIAKRSTSKDNAVAVAFRAARRKAAHYQADGPLGLHDPFTQTITPQTYPSKTALYASVWMQPLSLAYPWSPPCHRRCRLPAPCQ